MIFLGGGLTKTLNLNYFVITSTSSVDCQQVWLGMCAGKNEPLCSKFTVLLKDAHKKLLFWYLYWQIYTFTWYIKLKRESNFFVKHKNTFYSPFDWCCQKYSLLSRDPLTFPFQNEIWKISWLCTRITAVWVHKPHGLLLGCIRWPLQVAHHLP